MLHNLFLLELILGGSMKCLLIVSLILLLYSCESTLKKAQEKMLTPDHRGLHLTFAQELMDTAYIGLQRYHKDKGYYPNIEGKYFFDSIKPYVGKIIAFVYSDSWKVASEPFSIDSYLAVDSCYLSIGENMSVIYRPRKDNTFLLYWVGENGNDERGTGDDIVYKKDR